MADTYRVLITYGFGNIGRDKSDAKSSKGMDLQALGALRKGLPDTRAAVFLCEINEGDDNDELALVQRVFKGWTVYGRNTHEPILLSPDFARAKAEVMWLEDTAVKRWSPQRSLLRVDLDEEPTTLLAIHPPAGPHTAGSRPKEARAPLAKSWDICRKAHKQEVIKVHRNGRNVVSMCDANHYNFPRLTTQVQTVVHDRTDYGRVYPAKGYSARFNAMSNVNFNIDSHDGLRMRGAFVKQ